MLRTFKTHADLNVRGLANRDECFDGSTLRGPLVDSANGVPFQERRRQFSSENPIGTMSQQTQTQPQQCGALTQHQL
jgi:hypothetical protein